MKVKGSAPKKARRSSRTKVQEAAEANESASTPAGSKPSDQEAIARGGVATPFPWKLHEMLEDAAKEGNEWIVSWQPHGHSFIVHKPKLFVEKIMPTYFNQSKFASFQRQLNLYGFARLTAGRDKGAYYHNCFVRGQVHLCRGMVRQKIKGTKVRRTSATEGEPDFYNMTNGTAATISTSANEEEPYATKPKEVTKQAVKVPRKHHPKPSLPSVEAAPEFEEEFQQEPTVQSAAAPLSPSRQDVLAAKERAHKLRKERLDAVRDALKQTEMLCKDDDDEPGFSRESSFPTISIKPMLPSVSPLDSEVSDIEDDASSVFTPHGLQQQKIPPMPPLTTAPLIPAHLEAEHLPPRKVEPLVPRFNTMTPAEIKGGDVLFFEGKPFRYLEHLDSLPPPPPPPHAQAPSCHPPPRPKYWGPPSQQSGSSFPRDSLQSLMRVDPQALLNFRPMP